MKASESSWEPWAPADGDPWSLVHAGHLHRRAGFGAGWTRLQATLKSGPEAAVRGLLQPEEDIDAFNRQQDEMESAGGNVPEPGILRTWWLRRMIETPHPLREKMTLFWHGFFGVNAARAQDSAIVLDHVRTLRTHALGRFDEMLRQVLAQPAIYATNGAEKNRKARPSLAFARRLLENVAVGPGEFSEQDIAGVARAFTGWTVRRRELVFVEREHDDGEKSVMGTTGPLDREAVPGILLQQPALARHVVRRLCRFFISEDEEPGETLLQPLAESFALDFDISRLLETIFRSKIFYSESAYRRCVKSPVEFGVGLLRTLEGDVPGLPFGAGLAELGQDLYLPPTSRGWRGGRAWINPAMLTGRANLAFAMLTGAGAYKEKIRLADLARKHGFETPEQGAAFLTELLLQNDISESVREAAARVIGSRGSADPEERMKQVAYLIATLPEFQLS